MAGETGATPVSAAPMRRSTRSRPMRRGRNACGRRRVAGSRSATISAPLGIPSDVRRASLVSLSIPKVVWSVPRRLANFGIGTLAALLGITVVAGGALVLVRAVPAEKFVEYRMAEPQDAPIAIAAGADGTIWFTIDHADAIRRLRNGRIEPLPTSSRHIEPLRLAGAAGRSGWYTELPAPGPSRISHV